MTKRNDSNLRVDVEIARSSSFKETMEMTVDESFVSSSSTHCDSHSPTTKSMVPFPPLKRKIWIDAILAFVALGLIVSLVVVPLVTRNQTKKAKPENKASSSFTAAPSVAPKNRPSASNSSVGTVIAAPPRSEPTNNFAPTPGDEEPNLLLPPLLYSGQCSTLGRPCHMCEGDCENDSHCDHGLACFVRDSWTLGAHASVPGCGSNPSPLFAKDFCYNETLAPCRDVDSIWTIHGDLQSCSWVGDDLEARCTLYGEYCRQTCGYCRP